MLVGPGGIGIANDDVLSHLHRPHTVRDDAVIGEVAAADDVAGAHAGDGFPVLSVLVRIHERAAP